MSDYITLTKTEKEILSTFKYLEIDKYHFGVSDDEYDSEEIDHVASQLGDEKWFYGASKFVIVPSQVKYVVKIPFYGQWAYNEDDDVYVFDPYFTEDYCGVEADLYAEIADQDISMMFAATSFFATTKSGIPLYIQEKISETYEDSYENGNHSSHTPSKDSFTKAGSINKHSPFHQDWIASAIDYYGIEVVEHFLSFAKDNLTDMHSGNYGYRFDGSPVVHDFSGFDN